MSATLLCVQENLEIGRLYAETLEAEGYEVLRAHDGRGALEILRRQIPSFVILDLSLPRQDGFEVLAEMRMLPAAKSIPVLLVCEGDVTDGITTRAFSLGAVGVEASPMNTDRLVARVAEHVAKPAAKGSKPSRVPSEGSLSDIPIPELLRGLQIDEFDGVLLLEHGKKKKAIELRGGWPVAVKSNLISECLGNYLIKHDRCTKEELDESVKRMRSGEGLQGEILVAMEVLDEDAVVEVLQRHALEKMFEIFSWGGGLFKAKAGARIQRGSSSGLQGHPAKMIVEGVRHQFPLKQIDRYFELHSDDFLISVPEEQAQFGIVGIPETEAKWLHRIDGTHTLGSLSDAPESIRRMVFGLISIEVLGVQGAAGAGVGAEAFIELESVVGDAGEESVDSVRDNEVRIELANLANGMQNKDYYGVLDVSTMATDEEIRAAYASLAKQAHPDRFHGSSSSVRQLAAQVFDRIAKAYEGIATASDRKTYAAELSRGRRVAAVEDEGRRALQAETEYQRGLALVGQRDYEGALLSFGRAIENFPSEGEYRSHYGWCLYLCHPDNEVMLNEALEHCRAGVKLAKDREKPYLLLGRLYRSMGKAVAAKKMFTRAVEIRPQCVEAMRELRIMNMRREKDKGVLKRIFRR
jgi:CheY-like chemotaxis protein/tetratricopeptide (TPR) repeat protein